jgi:hypothetical protein
MNTRAASRLVWSMCGFSLTLAALSLLLLALNWTDPSAHVYNFWVENAILATIFSTVGAVVASRRPDHPVGWLFCAIGFMGGLRLFGAWYVTYTLLMQNGTLLGGWVAAWLASVVWVPHLGLFVFLGLLFPDGRLPSRRWRPFAWLVAVVVMTGTVAVAISPGSIRGFEPMRNPLGIEGAPYITEWVAALMYTLGSVAAASVFLRLRRARSVQRQQIKWYAYATVMLAASSSITYVGSEAIHIQWLRWVSFVPTMVALAGLPIAVAVAILRYRLYDIDIVINRTLVYGSLTAMLAAVYFGSVTVTEAIFRALTSQEQQPQLAIVVSTLVIAALFSPLRRRIQAFIDRRFYRRKYDAAKTLEAFSAKLRDETDLDALSDDLVTVVRETMQPSHVTLWLRSDKVSKIQQAN